MLKGIVNGAEHDITRIPMSGKNLAHANYDRTGSFLTWQKDKSTFTLNGSASAANSLLFSTLDLKAGTYTLSIHGLKEIGSGKTGLYLSGVDTVRVQTNRTYTITEDTTVNLRLVISVSDVSYDNEEITVMFNSGSTALPYEPYGYQNGWEVRDNQNRIIWGREDELQTTTGTLPFKGYDLPIKVKSLLGNATQNGTPSPDSPIIPEFCGVLNENLAIIESDTRTVTNNYYYDSRISYLLEAGTYTISFVYDSKTAGLSASIGRGDQNSYQGDLKFFAPPANGVLYKTTVTLTSAGYVWARFLRSASQSTFSYSVSKIRIEEGSSAYGWKIPLTNSGQTTPIYLGEVPTIRRIKKLVLTGTEDWKIWAMSSSSETERFYINVSGVGYIRGICSHFPFAEDSSDIVHFRYGGTNLSELLFWINKRTASTVDDFKSYLSTQYQNGTPVTVWYHLLVTEKGIVNEPLCKISTFADELTTIQVRGLSAPLYGIGDYKDILNLSTGVLTRNVKKLVLTGEENWTIVSGKLCILRPSNCRQYSVSMSTHFIQTQNASNTGEMYIGGSYINFNYDGVNDDIATFKSFLQQQYQAGTPVTIWYILTTSTTETVTVPTGMTGEIEGYLTQISTPTPTSRSVPKWNGKEETGGTYAVTVYNLPEIPTTTGKNTLTVDTTLAPYNVIVDGHIKYTYWGKIREDVRSGLAQTKFPVGTILYDNEDETTGRAFQVVGYDKHFDPSLTARGYNHSMTLCQLKLSGPWQFDATEAFLYTTVEMQPGTYKFKIPKYDTTYGGNKTYYFTSTASVPVNSQITLSWAYQQPPKTVTAYAGPNPQTKTTAITGFNALPLSEWIEGESPEAIDLGTIKLANNDPDSAYGKLNHIYRARYGSNNYYQSGLRQLLNTDLASNNWWHPTTVFDRPYANRTTNGYLRSLNEDFINVLATPEITHITNNIFEYPSLDGRTFTLNTEYKINTDKVFLLSHTEVGLFASPNIGTVLDYYSTHNTNNDRIKYRIDNGNAYYWWLRTPYPTNAHSFRRCYTSGALDGSGAYSALGVAPAHIIQ